MLPPSNQYVDEPLGYFTVKNTAIAEYISPNAASLIGVGVAIVSARLMANPEIKYRHLGVLLFKVRDYIDGLDGNIARERNHSHNIGQVANPSSFGWMVDGVCDGFGDIFRFIAFIFVLHRALQSGKQGVGYTLLPIDISDKGMNLPLPDLPHCGKLRGWLRCLSRFIATHQRALLIVVAVGLQSLFSSILWNYFMINYHRVLETDQYWGEVNYEGVVEAQGSILRSSSMWMVRQLSSELSRFVFSGLLFLATSQSSVNNTGPASGNLIQQGSGSLVGCAFNRLPPIRAGGTRLLCSSATC